jgi:hypothetical protein
MRQSHVTHTVRYGIAAILGCVSIACGGTESMRISLATFTTRGLLMDRAVYSVNGWSQSVLTEHSTQNVCERDTYCLP